MAEKNLQVSEAIKRANNVITEIQKNRRSAILFVLKKNGKAHFSIKVNPSSEKVSEGEVAGVKKEVALAGA